MSSVNLGRCIPVHEGVWNKQVEYDRLSVVEAPNGDSYTSKKRVPIGIELSNAEYWSPSGTYNAQVLDVKNSIIKLKAEKDKEINQLKETKADLVKQTVLETRMDTFVAVGKTSDNAETVDMRIGANGKVFGSAGEAQRTQFTELDKRKLDKSDLDHFYNQYFALPRDSRVYASKIYKYNYSTSSKGEKLLDNATLVAEPSTQLVKGRDDYQDIPIFKCYDCNFVINDQGDKIVTAVEGDQNIKRKGKVDVGVMQMSAYWKVEDHENYQIVYWSAMPNEKLGLQPWIECVRADGTVASYMIHTKYMQGLIDGVPYSSAGLAPQRNTVSHNTMMTMYSSKGIGYKGTTMEAYAFRLIMLMLKYATKNSQEVMAGCTNWSYQYKATIAESDVKWITIKATEAKNFYVGGYVSVGDATTNTNLDRGYAYMHNIADSVKITNIETVEEISKVYVDVPSTFNVTDTTYITTMHCPSGFLDDVLGVDGSYNSNTDGKSSMKIQGIECMVGGYEALGDTVIDITGIGTRDIYVANGIDRYNTIDKIKQYYKKVGSFELLNNQIIADILLDNDGCFLIQNAASGTSVGVGDRYYGSDTDTSGQREYLTGGGLGFGSSAGFGFLSGGVGLGTGYWYVLARI